MAETTIVLGDWNSVTPAAPEGSDNAAFAVDRSGAIPKFSASVKRADTEGDHFGTIIYDGSGDPTRYLGADGDWHDMPEGSLPALGSPGQLLAVSNDSPPGLEWVNAPIAFDAYDLSIVDDAVDVDLSLSRMFNLALSGSGVTINNPTGAADKMTFIIRVSGSGEITLGSKYSLRNTYERSSGRDYFGCVYDATADKFDTWYSKGV